VSLCPLSEQLIWWYGGIAGEYVCECASEGAGVCVLSCVQVVLKARLRVLWSFLESCMRAKERQESRKKAVLKEGEGDRLE